MKTIHWISISELFRQQCTYEAPSQVPFQPLYLRRLLFGAKKNKCTNNLSFEKMLLKNNVVDDLDFWEVGGVDSDIIL